MPENNIVLEPKIIKAGDTHVPNRYILVPNRFKLGICTRYKEGE